MIKIRFVEIYRGKYPNGYQIQRKTRWLGRWKFMGYWGQVWVRMEGASKTEVLAEAMKQLGLREDNTTIVEYPMISVTLPNGRGIFNNKI